MISVACLLTQPEIAGEHRFTKVAKIVQHYLRKYYLQDDTSLGSTDKIPRLAIFKACS
jgi:hypothetical protein